MKLYIKNMVCPRCIHAVKNILDEIGESYSTIELGKVETTNELSEEKIKLFSNKLSQSGFEILDSQEHKIINQIKTFLIEKIHYQKHPSVINLSDELSGLINREYSYISKLFSKVEQVTIEQFVLKQKIEKVKELLTYNELTMAEIADETGFSSAAHLSNQFKRMTGMNPSDFKKLVHHSRKFLDHI